METETEDGGFGVVGPILDIFNALLAGHPMHQRRTRFFWGPPALERCCVDTPSSSTHSLSSFDRGEGGGEVKGKGEG